MSQLEQDSYPYELAGAPAEPPQPAPADLVAAWRAYEAEELAELGDGPLVAAAGRWRMAGSLVSLLEEADAANPQRDKSSDGGIGNARHQQLGADSDHNPWLVVDKYGVVRARDFDVDGLDVHGAFERMRAAAHAGRLPQLRDGGYLILAGRITAPDFSRWLEYKGTNPHVTHGHVSVSRKAAQFDDRRRWNVWTVASQAPTSPTRPAPSRPPSPARPDLRGRYFELRGEQGATGPRVRALQQWFRKRYPRYAKQLADDGVWGPKTSAVVRQFGQRSGVRSADGLNIGPQLARKFYLAGFRG